MSPSFVPLAVIELSFDPELHLGAVVIPLRALALAAVIALALVVFARGVRARAGVVPAADIAFVVLATIPGAVVGGRLVHGLVFRDAYVLDPGALLDLGRGSLSLAGAVLGGALTAAYLCRVMGRSARVWADAAAVPLLLAIGGGKLAMLLGGAGQGLPWDGRGGVAFLGDGPWGSTDPAIPAYPTQLLEGAWALLGIPLVLFLDRRLTRAGRGGQGLVLLASAAWWLAGRAAVAVWWRDEPVLGPWGDEGIVALVLAVAAIALLVVTLRRTRKPAPPPARATTTPAS